MSIYISNATSEEFLAIDKSQNLVIRRNHRLRQLAERSENHLALTDIAESQFTEDKRMAQHLTLAEQITQGRVRRAKMVDPDRGVREDHLLAGRRLGTGCKSGSLPPSNARRRALSRSISALSASRSKADFSEAP